MKIAILSRDSRLYSCIRLVEAATRRGHEPLVLEPTLCHLQIVGTKPAIEYQGEILPKFDAVIPRIGMTHAFYSMAVLRQFEALNAYSLNSSASIILARDKLASCQLLSAHGVELPATAFAHHPDNIEELIAKVGGVPLVIKLVEGSQGIGVVLAETHNAAHSMIQTLTGLNTNIMVQEFIQEARGSDIRCFVIGDEVVAAMKRQGRDGEFRSNLHRGGSATQATLSAEERTIAIRAAKTIGLDVCGVDMLRSNRGSLVMEVNASPGLEGIEKACALDIADLMIAHIEKNRG